MPPQSLEAKILYDADKLDSIGAIGVARAYALAGRRGQRLWTEIDPLPKSVDSPVHEFVSKLSCLKDSLFTATARRMAEECYRYMVEFFEYLEREMKGEL